MNDEDIVKLVSKLTDVVATKEDLDNLEAGVKSDIKRLEGKINQVEEKLGSKIGAVGKKLEAKIDEVRQKADTILKYADAIEETTADHEKRLKVIEAVPVIAHELRAKN